MTNKNKERGTAFEYRVVEEAKARGFIGDRVPSSGAASGKQFKDDVIIGIGDQTWRGECKKTGKYKSIRIQRETINKLQKNTDFIAFACFRTPVCVVIPFSRYLNLLKKEAGL